MDGGKEYEISRVFKFLECFLFFYSCFVKNQVKNIVNTVFRQNLNFGKCNEK